MSKPNPARQAWPEELLMRLEEAQTRDGYVTEAVMAELSASLQIPLNDVYGVASFYTFLSVKPQGRHVIRTCRSLPCDIKNCQLIVGAIEREIGIKPGETTPDGRFSFELTNCIGLCDGAPAMLVDNDPHVNLTPEKIAGILKQYE